MHKLKQLCSTCSTTLYEAVFIAIFSKDFWPPPLVAVPEIAITPGCTEDKKIQHGPTRYAHGGGGYGQNNWVIRCPLGAMVARGRLLKNP